MLRDEGVVVEATWATQGIGAGERYREIDRELRRIAKRKAGLEVEEARWLREAEKHRIWRKLGYSTALEYLEDVFGYCPRTAKDRLRVAMQLGELPHLEAELRDGALPYSAARELTRVMTPATERQWLAGARGKNVHDIQRLVAGHKKGDAPDDPKDPALMTRRVVFELDARRDALLQQVRAVLEAERGAYLEDAELMEAMCMVVLRSGASGDPGVRASDVPANAARPAHQIVIRRCESCSRAWQQGRGRSVELTHADLELATCDAEIVRESDLVAAEAARARRPAPTLTIPKKTRDLIMARDEGRCRFPGCRATRHVAIHHIEHRAHGGGHEASNLLLLCDGHHKLLHDGRVSITGRAPDQLVFMRDGKHLVDARAPAALDAGTALRATVVDDDATRTPRDPATSTRPRTRFDDVVKLEHATQALRQLGFKTRDAKRALEQARAQVGTDADVPTLVRTVLADNGPSEAAEPDMAVLARQALVQSGFSSTIAAAAVATARAHVGTDIDLATLIKEALRHCR